MSLRRRVSLAEQLGPESRHSSFSSLDRRKPRNPVATPDADTDASTVDSASSGGSFDAGFALSALRHTVLSQVKTSAKGLVRKSGDRLKPLLQRSSDRILKPRQDRNAPKVLTEQQRARRKRRRDNVAKMMRMIHRVDRDPFVASRVVLALAALCLMLHGGDLLLAATMSCLGMLILHQTTRVASKPALAVWYYVSVASIVVSIESFVVCSYMERNAITIPASLWDRPQDQLWFWGHGVPRLWALLLAALLYRDIAQSKDGDDNAIETFEVEVALLSLKTHRALRRRHTSTVPPTTIVIQKGPIIVGSMDAKTFLVGSHMESGSNRFYTTALSHHLESTKGSFLRVHVKEEDVITGSTHVAFPGVHNMKISSWFPCGDASLLIEIQTRPLVAHFLFRASTLLPTIGCIALAAAFWN